MGRRVYLPSKDCKDFNLIGLEVTCASESVVSMPSSVSMAIWNTGVADVLTMRVAVDDYIISTSKHWTIRREAVNSMLRAEEVFGGRDVVRVGEGEDERAHMCFVRPATAPRQRSVSTKEVAIG